MTRDELQALLVSELQTIAPEIEGEDIDPDDDLRDAFDIDSMDFLNFIIAVHQALKVDIPESDYPQLVTLNGALSYLENAMRRG